MNQKDPPSKAVDVPDEVTKKEYGDFLELRSILTANSLSNILIILYILSTIERKNSLPKLPNKTARNSSYRYSVDSGSSGVCFDEAPPLPPRLGLHVYIQISRRSQ